MSNKNDFDFIKEKFESDGLSAPESLSAEELRRKLANLQDASGDEADAADGFGVVREKSEGNAMTENNTEKKATPRYIWGSIGAAAACIVAVALVGNAVIGPLAGNNMTEEYANMADAAQGALGTASGAGQETGGASEAGTGEEPETGIAYTAKGTTGMVTFSDYAELESQMAKLVPEEEIYYDWYNDTDVIDEDIPIAAADEDTPMAEVEGDGFSVGTAAAGSNSSEDLVDLDGKDTPLAGGPEDSSETYVQVKGVDEADIVKTDANHIYFLDEYSEVITIVEANDGNVEEVGKIDVSYSDPMIDDFYLYGDELITLGTDWDYSTDRESTVVVIYDISDPANPIEKSRYQQSGYTISSRMVGSCLYLVTDYYVNYYGDEKYIPYVTGENGYDKMNIADICAFPNVTEPEYVIAGSVDVSDGTQIKTKAKAVLGGSQDIYCNTENLYVVGYYYNPYMYYAYEDEYLLDDGTEISGGDVIEEDVETGMADPDAAEESGTPELQEGSRIFKISLNDGNLRFEASCMVEGYTDDQFSMDEKDGYLRIATTSTTAHGYDINNLFVLDEGLNQVGAVTGFAKNEHIEAVRYIGDKAYVITYEQTDPLFVIDVSDPTNPQIEGSVKIEGFSTLLVPADENTLFGIGYATSDTQWGEAQDGLKFVTFDVSNPSVPAVKDVKEYLNAYSEAQYNHKALIHNAEKDYYAIPYEQDDENYYVDHYGVLVLRITNGKIKVLKDFQEKDTVRRCVYIGDYIYAICEDDMITSYKMGG